jgi:hypothetical protein
MSHVFSAYGLQIAHSHRALGGVKWPKSNSCKSAFCADEKRFCGDGKAPFHLAKALLPPGKSRAGKEGRVNYCCCFCWSPLFIHIPGCGLSSHSGVCYPPPPARTPQSLGAIHNARTHPSNPSYHNMPRISARQVLLAQLDKMRLFLLCQLAVLDFDDEEGTKAAVTVATQSPGANYSCLAQPLPFLCVFTT